MMKNIIRMTSITFSHIWKTNKKVFIIYFFSIIFNSLSPIYYTIFSKYIIDSLYPDLNVYMAFFYAFLMLFLQLINASILKFIEYKIQNVSSIILMNEKKKLLNDLDDIFFESTENSKYQDDYNIAKEYIYRNSNIHIMNKLSIIISNIISLIVIIIFLKEVSIFAIILCVILYFIKSFFDNKKNKKIRDYFTNNYNLIRKIQYSTSGFASNEYTKENRMFNTFPYISKQIDNASKNHANFSYKLTLFNLKYSLIPTIISSVILIVIYSYMAYTYNIRQLTIGDYSMLIAAFLNFSSLVNSIIGNFLSISNEKLYFDKYLDFMNYKKVEIKEEIHINEIKSIEFVDVSYIYPNSDKYALKNVNIKITNKKISLVGENGSGKSTFIKLLMKLYKPTNGKILINGIDIENIDTKSYYELFSPVFQDFKIYSSTISENICFDKPNDNINNYIEKVGLAEKINNLPNKENSIITKLLDDDGIDLSGGERQKIAIARSLYKQSLITIYDEPTASLSAKSENELYQNLNDFINDTCIFISHRLSSCRFTDKIIVLENGELIEYGSHDELMAKKGLYHRLFESQAQNYEKEVDSYE